MSICHPNRSIQTVKDIFILNLFILNIKHSSNSGSQEGLDISDYIWSRMMEMILWIQNNVAHLWDCHSSQSSSLQYILHWRCPFSPCYSGAQQRQSEHKITFNETENFVFLAWNEQCPSPYTDKTSSRQYWQRSRWQTSEWTAQTRTQMTTSECRQWSLWAEHITPSGKQHRRRGIVKKKKTFCYSELKTLISCFCFF